MNTFIENLTNKEAEIRDNLSPLQFAVANAMWGSVASSDHVCGPILDFGPGTQHFIDLLADSGFVIHSIKSND